MNVLVIAQVNDESLAKIKSVDPHRLNVISAYPEFLDEIVEDNYEMMSRRAQTPQKPQWTPAEREATLSSAHAIFLSFPLPKTLISRAKNALWFHCPFAGVSNLKDTAYWGSNVTFTTSRGYTQALPIAETAVGSAMMFAKRLDTAAVNTKSNNFDRTQAGQMVLLEGKTMGIVGLGGIGRHVARLSKGLGMKVLATRRSTPEKIENSEGVDTLFPATLMNEMLPQCDFLVVASMWTNETQGLIDSDAIKLMKDGASLINIARGEIVDEASLVEALNSGKLAHAYIDVYKDDFTKPPSKELANAQNIVITPHISGRSDISHAFSVDVFCNNLRRILNQEDMENVVDWERGY